MTSTVKNLFAAIAVALGCALISSSASAQNADFVKRLVDEGTITQALADRVLSEKEARSACKKEICELFAEGGATDGAVTCEVTKTWLRQELTKSVLGDRLDWPYGNAQCKTKLNLDRKSIAQLRQGGGGSYTLPDHNMACVLENQDGGEAYNVSFNIAPTITFENGKATDAEMNWGDIEGSTLASTAIWSAVKADSLFGVIDSIAVEQVNAFVFRKCQDVGVNIAASE